MAEVQPIFRYQYMVTEIGTIVLRQLFDHMVGPDVWSYLNANTQYMSIIRSLKQTKLSDNQRKLLPPDEKYPTSSKFDFTLLLCLLRNVCGLRRPGDAVWVNPNPNDLSIEAYLTRLRICRNAMVHGSLFLPEAELDQKIKDVAMILHNLSDQFGNLNLTQLIIEAQYLPLDELQPADKGVIRQVPSIDIKGSISNPTLIPEISSRNLLRLSSLSLYDIKMEHSSLSNMVMYLTSNVRIEHINLSYVSCKSHGKQDEDCMLYLDLAHHSRLASLRLYYVNIICGSVNHTRLKSITLYPVSERIVRSYGNVFNSIQNSHLEEVNIYGSLYRFDNSFMKAMTSAVKTLKHIKYLNLKGMNLPNSLEFHTGVTNLKIDLEYVTMSSDCFQSFATNCIKHIPDGQEIHVEFNYCTIQPGGESHAESWRKAVYAMYDYFTNKIPSVKMKLQDEFCLHLQHFKQTSIA